ncbi:hypothetical protein HDU67_002156 [Dinochytrium kinnereticum]|nr:hypothetical protein HDU67_002156 [Dinochytrium kinnereticum]
MESGPPTCPHCGGEFIEIIESSSDPRLYGDDEGESEDFDFDEEEGFVDIEGDGDDQSRPTRTRRRNRGGAAGGEDPRDALASVLAAMMRQAMTNRMPGGPPTQMPMPGFGMFGVGGFQGGFGMPQFGQGATGTGTAMGPQPRQGQTAGYSEQPAGETPQGGEAPSVNAEETPNARQQAALMNMMEMLQHVLVGAGVPGADARSLFNMVGNPGDYVFGQQGLDAIITQLMDQNTLRNAPPPASDSAISNLPRVKVKGCDLGEHPECAVCQDEFTSEGDGEVAIRLLCNHNFHPHCIENWLKVNGTCPVCRKKVEEELSPEGPPQADPPEVSG